MASPEKLTELQKKMTKQIEYYFGDKNLPKDKFMLQKIEEGDGWLTLDCLMTFTRLKGIVYDVIVDALRTHGSGLVEVDEANRKLRRAKAMPDFTEEYNLITKEKTIYCKGFPETTTLDEIEEFFEDKGKCVNIKMRRTLDEDKKFKGSVFVEFETKEEANAFVAKENLKYKDNELTYMTRDDYFKSKKLKSKNGVNQSANAQSKSTDEDESQKENNYPKGRVLHFAGVGDQTSREDIKETFSVENIEVKWVNFNIGDKEGFVRFSNDGDAEKAMKIVLEKNDNKLEFRGVETTLRLIEGDEEKDYWKKAKEDMAKFQKNKRGGKKNFRGGMKRGRNDSRTKDEPPVKQVKSDV